MNKETVYFNFKELSKPIGEATVFNYVGWSGLHVTKFYMFLKRWLAEEHTEKFLEFFWLYEDLEQFERRDVINSLQALISDTGMRLSEATGLSKDDLKVNESITLC